MAENNNPFYEKDNRLFLKENFLEIYLPKFYFDNDIARFLGRRIETYGIFNFKFFSKASDKSKAQMHTYACPLDLILTPESFELELVKEISEEDKTYVLHFRKDELVIDTIEMIIKQAPSFTKFMNLLTSGRLPKTIPYDDVKQLALDLQIFNKRDLGIPALGYEIIISEIYRDPDDISKPFRYKAGAKKGVNLTNYRTINLRNLANESAVFTGLIFEDFTAALQSAVIKTQSGNTGRISPIEKTIKY